MIFYVCDHPSWVAGDKRGYCLISENGMRALGKTRDPIRCVRHGCLIGSDIEAESRQEARRTINAAIKRAVDRNNYYY